MIIENPLALIGQTPLFRLNDSNIFIKLEKFNLGGSIKDRAALGMIEDAEKKGLLKDGSVIIEPTSGNTGIGLALIGRIKGYKVVIVMPDTMSQERRTMIEAYGAELILTKGSEGMNGAIRQARMLAESDERYFMPDQFSNNANWLNHYNTTALEIIKDLPEIDLFISGVGTGGSFTGISKRLKEFNKDIICVAAEPSASPVLSGGKAGPHKIQGMGPGFVTDIFKYEYADHIIKIDYEDAERETLKFSKQTGIIVGLSSGANIWAAKIMSEKFGTNKKIVTIAPDGGEKYLSLGIYK
ncbi:MAG TPA: cysteine synthase A [Clostridiales bacterium]|jgi:cysteine synthase A|nr:cysteine synthase A [Clostridiales bacterium]